ncbi:Early nodulin-93 [Nymphaea thermarum]|nr:Early nodulin-93 [Nymphaea thermarum]
MTGSIPSELSKSWRARRESLLIPSPAEKPQLSFEQQRAFNTKQCTEEGVRAGLKAAVIAAAASAVPTLVGVRVIPWAKANLNYTAQALIISSGSEGVASRMDSAHGIVARQQTRCDK